MSSRIASMNRILVLVAALIGVTTSALLAPAVHAQNTKLIGDADGNGIFDRQDVLFLRAFLASGAALPSQPNLLSDVAAPCDGLDTADLFLLDRAARQAEPGRSRSTPAPSHCHGTLIGTVPPDPHAGSEAIPTLDDLFALIADQIPEFAGVYFDEGVPTIALTNPDEALLAEAEAAVIEVFGWQRFSAKPPFRAAVADFGFGILHEARQQARELLSAPEIITLDIDELRNRLVVGIRDASAHEYVEDLLSRDGILVETIVTEVSTYEAQNSLVGTIRPIRAGRQIREPNWSRCTMGPIVDLFGVRGWLTNSHCTPQFGVTNNIKIAQSWDEFAGIEDHDPYFGPGLDYSACNGLPCRWSDSVFMDASRLATSYLGMVDEDPGYHRFFSSVLQNPLCGESVCMTGKNSGTQCGQVTATCADRHVDDEEWNWNYHLFCQTRSNLDTEGGDSGGPVYQPQGFSDAVLVGMHHGEGGNGEEFSPVSGLQKDLGPIQALLSNAAPKVTITKPSDWSSLGEGNPYTLTLEADYWDEEKGDECSQCIIYWSSDKDGGLGSSLPVAGKATLTVSIWGAGQRVIKAVGHDGSSFTGEDTITLTTENTPPQVSIDFPASGTTVWRNFEYIFQGSSFDIESFASLACTALEWKASGATIGTGCFPTLSFSTLGYHVIELIGTDPGNDTGTDIILVNVMDPPAGSPPIAEILAPTPNVLHPSDQVLPFTVQGIDPDDASPLTYEWILKGPGLQPITLFSSNANNGEVLSFQFVPEDHLYVPCGGRPIDLELEVTDADNMVGTKTISATIGRPPC